MLVKQQLLLLGAHLWQLMLIPAGQHSILSRLGHYCYLPADGILNLLMNVCDGLVVYEKVVRARVMNELPFMATENVMMDAVKKGERVLLIDDLLATGGTAAASAQMIGQFGGEVAEIDFLIELAFLKGREKLQTYKVFAPVVF